MRSVLAAFIAVVAAFAVSSADGKSGAAAAVYPVENFNQFWASFRDAVLTGDAERLISMSQDKIAIPGELDDDPVRWVSRATLVNLLPKVLAQDSEISSREAITNRSFIDRLNELPKFGPGIAIGKQGAQIGPFQFRFSGGKWLLTGLIVKGSAE